MAFVNEEISKEDWEKYNIDQISSRYSYANGARNWIIDREKDIWLRFYYQSRDRDNNGEPTGPQEWDFYWKGHYLILKKDTIKYESDASIGKLATFEYTKYGVVSLTLSLELNARKKEIIKDVNYLLSNYRTPSDTLSHDRSTEISWEKCIFIIV